jgi:hypothetical protein
MKRRCHGLQLCNPSQQTVYTTTTNMFVDDASNCTNRVVSWLHYPPSPLRNFRNTPSWLTDMGEVVVDVRSAPEPTQVRVLYSCMEIRCGRPPKSHSEV